MSLKNVNAAFAPYRRDYRGVKFVPTAMGSDDVVTFLGRWERSVRS